MTDFAVRTAAVIRATILGNVRSRYLALNHDIATDPDTDAYNWADSVSVELEGIEARALQLTLEIFPDTASRAFLDKHGDLIGLARKPATSAVLTLAVTGSGSSTWATTNQLAATTGLLYAPNISGALVAGVGTADVTALTKGIATNQAIGAVLTWVSPPAGINTIATVTAIVTVAADEETDADYATRIIAWWRERPGAGNRADFLQWIESRSGIAQGYVNPLDHPSLGTGTLGAVILSILGPANQRTTTAPLGVGTGNVTDVLAYVLGTTPYAGTGRQLPAFVDPADVTVEIPALTYQDVTATIVPVVGYEFPFVGTFTKAANAGNTTSRIYVTADPTAIILVGMLVAIDTRDGGSFVHGKDRGAYQVRTVSATNSAYIEVSEALGAIPSVGNLVRPASKNWEAMRDAVIAVFDRLGPATEVLAASARFPDYSVVGPATLYRAALTAALMSVPGLAGAPAGVAGVTSATITTPGSDPVPAARAILVPGAIVFTV